MPLEVSQASPSAVKIPISLYTTAGANVLSATVSVSLSKNDSAFASATGTVQERGNGIYWFTPSALDVNTTGAVVLLATASGAVDYKTVFYVVSASTNAQASAAVAQTTAASIRSVTIYRNRASQFVLIYAHDISTKTPKTGDSSNIVCKISIDGATAVTTSNSVSEFDSTEAPGFYRINLTQAETNGNTLLITSVSSTPYVVISPLMVECRAASQYSGSF